ncbi:MAG: bifunctional N(6)-L-threonylcarbamoyladenine synthase/serine/threonine protein kinase [Candidatus Diapherotrites archaeon]|nr:bifunctional N(6)-L-threonylcarbamoyladenine synthase/serine/threonine protein kinase [Candidatus Diapherotrites archaeon]
MLCLGIESTAHTIGIGIIDSDFNILANEKDTLTTEKGGLVPKELADHHYEKFIYVLKKALQKANVSLKEIDLIAFSIGPGIGNALKVGATAARALSLKLNVPLIGVNHCVAHIEAGKAFTKSKDPIVVYASGANTQIIGFQKGKYRVFGETLDTGIGNLLDSFGREIGMGFPAGPKIDENYFKSNNLIELPYSVKGMDLAFSGLLTAITKIKNKYPVEDLCYSLMHTSFAMIAEVTERALAHTGKKEVLLTGGVACSKALQKMIQEMCVERKAKLFITPPALAVDNGAMIAIQGIIEFNAGNKTKIINSAINQRFRTDDVKVNWI